MNQIPQKTPAVDLRNLITHRLDAQGNEVEAGSAEHVITHFPQVGLMFDARPWKVVSSTAQAAAHVASVDLLGRKGDWVVGEDVETAVIIKRAHRAPAVDRSIFPHAPDHGVIYTATPLHKSPGCVWFVYLNLGYVGWSFVDYGGLVVPVLRVPPSQ